MKIASFTANKLTGCATARDGTQLAYKLHIQGHLRRRVALVHSLALDGAFWTPVVEQLIPHADVLVFDCRGHGASGKPAGPYSVELFADDLADLLDHVGWSSALVAGASMGGSVSLAFAAKYPDRTAALGLIDTTAWYGADAPERWAERSTKAVEEGLPSLVNFQQTRWFGDEFRKNNPTVVDACAETFMKNQIKAYAATCQMLGTFDLRSALSRLSMPTAVVVGEDDYATPVPMARVLHDGIAGSSLKVIKGARHLTPLECPALIAEAIIQLLDQVTQ
jgi:3-oxoadipate enol-lactonase